jgi:hypothetical protein
VKYTAKAAINNTLTLDKVKPESGLFIQGHAVVLQRPKSTLKARAKAPTMGVMS